MTKNLGLDPAINEIGRARQATVPDADNYGLAYFEEVCNAVSIWYDVVLKGLAQV